MAMTRTGALALLTASMVASVPALVTAPGAGAAPADRAEKVRICHRTSAVANPYVSIEVARSSVDGDAGNDRGQGDHYALHAGPAWSVGMPKGAGWGDIIPPVSGVHEGRNWTAAGQAIWGAGCQPADLADADGDDVRWDMSEVRASARGQSCLRERTRSRHEQGERAGPRIDRGR